MNENQLLKRLEVFTNIDSGVLFKEDVDSFSHIIEEECRGYGLSIFRHKQVEVGDFLEIAVGTGKCNILLLGHMDTVFTNGTAAARPFRCEGNRVYGPGVLDMKGGLCIILLVMKKIAPFIPHGYKVTAFLNSDEEIGSRYSEKYIRKLASVSEAVLSFEGAKPETLTTERKGIIAFDIVLTGVAAHSGVNHMQGSSAIEAAAHKIKKLYALNDSNREVTVNIGMISGGNARNIVAPCAKIEGEIRYYTYEDRKDILNHLTNITNDVEIPCTSAEIQITAERPALIANDKSTRLFEFARQEAEMLGRKLRSRKTGGGGDASFAGLYPIAVLDGLGPEGENSHTDDEYILANSLTFKEELAVRIINKFLQGVAV